MSEISSRIMVLSVNTSALLQYIIFLVLPWLCSSRSYILINEVNVRVSGSSGVSQFVEIACFNTPPNCQIPFNTYKLVFYDSTSVYKIITLPEKTMSAGDLLLIGPSDINPWVDWGNFQIHLDSPSAVTLFYDPGNLVTIGTSPTWSGLVSWFSFSMESPANLVPSSYSSLFPKDAYFHYLVPEPDKSISYCRYSYRWRTLARPTPGAPNACPSGENVPDVLINEVNAASPRGDRYEFVELINIAFVPVHLGNYSIVLYDGRTNVAYMVIHLANATLPPGEVYVVGSYRLNPHPDQIFGEGTFRALQNGADGVALYKHSNQSQYYVGMDLTDEGLVDALVYDVRGRHSEALTAILTPGQETLHEDWRALRVDESLSRCYGTDARNSSQFVTARRSPGESNICSARRRPGLPSHMPSGSLSPVIINEFSLEVSNQYIELYDGGIGNYQLDGLLVVLYSSRSMRAYTNPVSLNGYVTDENGYFLIKVGDASEVDASISALSTIDINAISLYKEHSNNIVRGSIVTPENLADVVFYGTPAVSRQTDLTDVLLPGSTPLGMDEILLASNSYSRCKGWAPKQVSSFLLTRQTPNTRNNCPLPQLVINEVDLPELAEERFVELLSSDQGNLPLDGVILVIYEGSHSSPSYYLSLDNYATNEAGLLTIGHENGTNVDIAVDDPEWTMNIGAVTIYLGPITLFEYTSDSILREGLIDGLLVSPEAGMPNLDLMNFITPHQKQLNDLDEDTSISRCICCGQRDTDSFGSGPPSPGAINSECRIADGSMVTESLKLHQALLRINEIYTTPDGNGLYIELYDKGYSGVKMDDLTLSLYSSGHQFYSHYTLRKDGPLGVTNNDGFYFIGTTMAGISMNMEVHRSERLIRETTNAIVLWKNTLDPSQLTQTTFINKSNIIDAVAFSDNSLFDFRLSEMFTTNQANITLNSTFMTGAYSISRCHSRDAADQLAFAITVPTPGAVNTCPMPSIVINEVNVMVFGFDLGEFVEISSLGVPNYPLSNVVLVLYGTNGHVYNKYDLNGKRTDSNGLFVLGYNRTKFPVPDMPVFTFNGNYIKNGPDVVALHKGKVTDFPHRSAGTNKNLIDAVVYGVNQDEVAQNLIDTFTPGKQQAFEITSETEVDESINRCVEGGEIVYRSAHVSPKFPNFCPNNVVKLLINEISLDPDNQFIEIWDVGISLSSLDNTSIVLFNREGVSYMEIPLTNHRTDSGGYFVVGTSSVSPRSQYANSFASGFIRTTSGAVSLYKSMPNYNAEDGSILTAGLLDAMIYVDPREQLAGTLLESLTPGSSPLPSLLLQEEDSSISRCFSAQLMTNDVFSVRPITPLGLNDCPVFETDVIINEINVDEVEDSENSRDFVELFDGGKGNSSLDGLTLVLFNAGHEDRSYLAIGLDGYRTNGDGFFVIGASTSMDNPDISLPSTGFLHNGPDGVAVYRAPQMAFTYGTVAEPQSVVDGIVYSLTGDAAVSMATKLTPGYPTFLQRSDFATASISRCYGNVRRNPTKFGLASPSPGRPNNCSSASDQFPRIIINEVNIEQGSNKNAEFIEIYSPGAGDVSLDGLTLIFFDGANRGRSYFEVDLNGGRTNNNGFYTIGRSNSLYVPDKTINHNFVQEGPDAVVLYRRPLADFPRGTVATLDGALDVLVYGSNGQEPSVLVDILSPGEIQVNEQQYSLSGKGSLSRCLSNDSMTMYAFITSYSTPGSRNNCTLSPIYINEINFDISKEDKEDFVELFDGGKGFTPLDALVLVFFSEISGTAFRTLSLQNNLTDMNGYFTIGGANVMTDLTVDSTPLWGMLARYPGAVALYRGSSTDYQIGMKPTTTNLIDALVLGSLDTPASSLAAVLSPDQSQILEEKFFMEGDESISRCRCCIPLKTSEFGLGLATPKGPNTCSVLGEIYPKQAAEEDESQRIVINEVKLTNGQDGLLPMELEILWSPRQNLDNYVIIYYSADRFGSTSYLTMALSGESTDDNGFYSLTEDKAAKLEYLQYSRGRDRVQAVSIYDRTSGQYSYGMTATDKGLQDAVTLNLAGDDTVKQLQSVLTPATPALAVSEEAKNFLASYQPLSLSRCGRRSTRNNSAFVVTSWTSGKPNLCPTTDYATLVQLRLTNAIYTQWTSNSAWRMLLKDVIVNGVEKYCQCGFSLPYFTNESMFEYEGSVVYEVNLLGLEKRQRDQISMSIESFVKLNSTITIMDQRFLLDDCVQCLMNPLGRRGRAGSIVLSLLGVLVLVAVIAIIVVMAHRYRGDLHILYIKTLKAKGSLDGVKFNNNQGGVDVGIDEGIANPVYQGTSEESNPPPPKFQDPAVNASGEVPAVVITC